jgi:hypothetical protein
MNLKCKNGKIDVQMLIFLTLALVGPLDHRGGHGHKVGNFVAVNPHKSIKNARRK